MKKKNLRKYVMFGWNIYNPDESAYLGNRMLVNDREYARIFSEDICTGTPETWLREINDPESADINFNYHFHLVPVV